MGITQKLLIMFMIACGISVVGAINKKRKILFFGVGLLILSVFAFCGLMVLISKM